MNESASIAAYAPQCLEPGRACQPTLVSCAPQAGHRLISNQLSNTAAAPQIPQLRSEARSAVFCLLSGVASGSFFGRRSDMSYVPSNQSETEGPKVHRAQSKGSSCAIESS